jgi:hypothetical protein
MEMKYMVHLVVVVKDWHWMEEESGRDLKAFFPRRDESSKGRCLSFLEGGIADGPGARHTLMMGVDKPLAGAAQDRSVQYWPYC